MEPTTTIGYHQFLMDESQMNGDEAGGRQTSGEDTAWNRSAFGNETLEEPPYEGPEWIVVPLVFGLIFIVGVVGNGTLIFTVLVNKNMRTTPNVLLVSLAVGDRVSVTWSMWPGQSDLVSLTWSACPGQRDLVSVTWSVWLLVTCC